MKQRLRFFVLCAAFMLLIPSGFRLLQVLRAPLPDSGGAVLPGSYRVLCTQTGEISEIPLRDYLIGAVGAEMPASYEPEALKAQVIACHTYAERMRRIQQKTPDPAFCGADLSDDCDRCQAYDNEETLRARWGADYPQYYEKIAAAVDAAGDLLLCFDGEPVAAVFHAVSAGETDPAEAVWGTALPYLIPVDSADDREAPDYLQTAEFSAETVKAVLCAAEPACAPGDDPAAWFSGAVTTKAGTVLQIQAGGAGFSGQRIRELFGLRSAAFTAEYTGSVFRFTVRGFGHNVGMSQYGANAMAKKGSRFDEILLHYYPDTVLLHTAELRSAVCAAVQPAVP